MSYFEAQLFIHSNIHLISRYIAIYPMQKLKVRIVNLIDINCCPARRLIIRHRPHVILNFLMLLYYQFPSRFTDQVHSRPLRSIKKYYVVLLLCNAKDMVFRQFGNLPKRGWGKVGAWLGHRALLGQGWGRVNLISKP